MRFSLCLSPIISKTNYLQLSLIFSISVLIPVHILGTVSLVMEITTHNDRKSAQNIQIQNHPVYWIFHPINLSEDPQRSYPSVHLAFTIRCAT